MRSLYGTMVILFLVALAQANTLREFRIGDFNIRLRGKALQKCQNNLLSSLKQNQREKCERYQRTLDAVNKGIAMALAECKNVLTNHAWNCSGLNTSQILEHQGILQTDTRESAFVNALTSAAVLYKLAEGCVNGKWGNCRPSIKDKLNPKNRNKDCCLHYVERISKKLLNPKSSDLRSLVIRQNNRAGRTAFWTNMKRTCIYQTRPVLLERCWHILPNFKEVAEYLLRKKQSRKVCFDKNTTILVETALKKSKIKTSDLVHTDKSPNFCRPDPTLGILGTQGRLCSENSGEDNYCGTFCCGEGYKTTARLATKICNCRFVWCCRVECQSCNYTLVEHRCNGEQQQ